MKDGEERGKEICQMSGCEWTLLGIVSFCSRAKGKNLFEYMKLISKTLQQEERGQ